MSEVGSPLLSSDETPSEVLRRAEELEVTEWAGAIPLRESANRTRSRPVSHDRPRSAGAVAVEQ